MDESTSLGADPYVTLPTLIRGTSLIALPLTVGSVVFSKIDSLIVVTNKDAVF